MQRTLNSSGIRHPAFAIESPNREVIPGLFLEDCEARRTAMDRRGVFGRRWRIAVLAIIAAIADGCAGRRPQGTNTTLGADLFRGPAGVTYPATSLGVDLVRQSREANRDKAVAPANSNSDEAVQICR